MEMVIYKSLGVWHCTTKANYTSMIQDARLIQKLADFDNPQEIIEYYCKYFNSKPNEFTIIDNQSKRPVKGVCKG